jgi:hypothetical protein
MHSHHFTGNEKEIIGHSKPPIFGEAVVHAACLKNAKCKNQNACQPEAGLPA